MNFKIIEQSNEEYLRELREFYETEMKPLMEDGMSFTKTVQSVGLNNSSASRKYQELKSFAIKDGYMSENL